jgi:hypothetical protein
MAPQKRLSWEEWQRRANADYVKGEFGVQQMISSWGYPEGMSAETHKIEFDKGKVRQRDRANRRARRAKYNAARTIRIGSSRKIVNRAIRDEAAAQWDELVGDRNATIVIGGKPYSFDKYLNKEVRDHSKLTRQKAVEAVNLGKSLGHGTPTTDVGRYAESYTQQFAETPTGNYTTQDFIPPDQLERLQKAGLATSPQEAARLHVGTTKIGGRLPDVKIEEILKINASGNLARAGSRGAQNIGGYLPVPIPTGSQLKQLAPGIKGQLPFAASSAIEPLKRGEPTKALEEVAKGTAVGMATDPIVKPIMSRLIPAVGSVAAAAPVATTAAAAVASELVAPRAAQGGPERVTVNGTPYWLDKKANKVYTNDGRPTNFGIDIKGGKPQLVQRGQGAGTKRAEADPLRQAAKGNLMPVLNMLNPMTQLLRFSNSAMKTIREEV